MRRRKKKQPSESESTGKVGQPKPEGYTPLQPIYPEDLAALPPREARPAAPAREGRPAPPAREARPAPPAREPRLPAPAREGRPAPPPREARPPARPKIVVETQPESVSAPPAGKPEGLPPGKPAARAPKGVVVLAIGLPGSGKTTWFKRRGVTPLSSDTLRTILFDSITEQRYQSLVFSTLRSLLRARLIAKMPWNYVDATNLSPRERRQWIHMAKDFGFETHAVFFDVPVEVCMERNRKRERVVPEDVMQRMAAKLKPPTFAEGFSKITVVRVKQKAEEPHDAGSWESY
ncbi:MAG TPA: AAA family ATPase [Terriglobales bacterium]|nr:AAA family ATPase [Terriglobales bacterium]